MMAALDEFTASGRSIVRMLSQGETWVPKNGPAVAIADMAVTHRFNSAAFLLRRAPMLADGYGWGELTYVSEASDEVADMLATADEDRMRNPRRWLAETTLFRALVADLPANRKLLQRLADRARHWSTCPGNGGALASCSCAPGPLAEASAIDAIRGAVKDVRRERAVERVRREAAERAARIRADWEAKYEADPDVDPDTGEPWGFCDADSCGACGGYHAGRCD